MGKNILLLCENFYDYDKMLKREFYNLGAQKLFLLFVILQMNLLNYPNYG